MKKYSKLMAVLLVVAMLLPGIAQAAPVAQQAKVMRVAGETRVGTSLKLSEIAMDTAKEAVLVGYTGEADALTGGILAKAKDAPLFFVRASEVEAVKARLDKLGVEKVHVLGGTTVFTEELMNEFNDYAPARITGDNRYETAIAVAKVAVGETADTVFLAKGNGGLADALAIGAISAKNNTPLLLTHDTHLTEVTKQALKDMGVKNVEIVGGKSAVSEEIKEELEGLGYTVNRTAGDNRQATSVEIAKKFNPEAKEIVIANGFDYADAVTAGYFAAGRDAVVLLTNQNLVHPSVKEFLEDNKLDTTVLGGTSAIAKGTFDKVVEYLDGVVVEMPEEEEPTEELAIESVSAIGAKKLEVTFNKAIEETTKAIFAVKKGTIAVNTDKIEFAEDKMSATITTTTNLTKGDYTVTVTGLTEEALTATVTVENEKVSEIKVAPKAPRISSALHTASASYEVLNQYGEKMVPSGITWTASTGKAVTSVGNDKLTIENAGTTVDFIPGAKVYLTGVHATSGTVVNAEVEVVLESQANTVEFKGVYDTNKGELTNLPAGFDSGRYVLLLEVNDQYGNKIASPDMTKLVFTSNNPAFVSSTLAVASPTTVTIEDVVYEAIQLAPGSMVAKGGKVTIQAISTVTGATSSFEIDADALSAVKTFAMSAPAKMVAEKEKVEIPFTAVDQYGNAITKYETLNSQVTLSPAFGGGTGLKFVKQNDGSAKLEYTAPATGATATTDLPVYLTSLVTQGGDFSSLMLSVKEEAVPTTISGLNSKISQSIAKGNNVEILGSDLVILDQYGREMTKAAKEAWLGASTNANRIVVTSEKPATDKSPFTVVSTHAGEGSDGITRQIDTNTEKITIAAKTATGLNKTEKLIFALSTDSASTTIASSAKSLTFTSVEQSLYSSYEVEDLGTMYNDGHITNRVTTHDKTLKVYGVLANGTKVLLPASDYSVSTDGKLDTTTTNGVIADLTSAGYDNTATPNPFKDANGNDKDIKVNVLVTVNDTSGAAAAILQKELLVSNKAPEVATIGLDSDKVTDGKATITANGITNAELKTVIDTEEVKDQYGVKITEQPVITITKLVKVEGSAFTVIVNGTDSTAITGAKMGDKFTATYKYASGKTVAVDFTVGLDTLAPTAIVNGTATNDATEFTITPSETVTVAITGQSITTNTASVSGNVFSVDSTGATSGDTITFTITDSVGKVTTYQATFTTTWAIVAQ